VQDHRAVLEMGFTDDACHVDGMGFLAQVPPTCQFSLGAQQFYEEAVLRDSRGIEQERLNIAVGFGTATNRDDDGLMVFAARGAAALPDVRCNCTALRRREGLGRVIYKDDAHLLVR
jgi:hypothetical protein